MASNNSKIGTFQRIPLEIQAMRLREPLERPAVPKQYIEGKVGDWMVFGVDGKPYFVPDAVFRRLYKPTDEVGQAIFEANSIYER